MDYSDNKKTKEIEKFFKTKKLLFAAWSCESRFYSTLSSWHAPLKKIFNKVIVFDPQKYIYLEGRGRMNEHFLDILKKEQPDFLVLYCDVEGLSVDTLFKIKEIAPNVKVIDFHGDDDTNFEDHSRYVSLISDYVLVGQDYIKEYKKEGIKNVFSLYGTVNPEIFKPLNLEKKYNLTFVGTPRAERYNLIKFLKENKIDVRVFGNGWENYPDLKEVYMGHPDNTEMAKIFNESRINLCFSKNIFGKLHIKGRVFEVGACGSFAICEYYKTLGNLFREGKEIIMFKTKEELLEKVKYYLENDKEREKIAEAMHKKINKKYNLYSELFEFFKEAYKLKNIQPKKLPVINKKVLALSEEDFEREEAFIKNKVRNYDYITFENGQFILSKYKNYLQSYSLIKFKKPISCCDYYIYSDRIGIYLISASNFFYKVSKEELPSILDINQLMVAKPYFLKNLPEFYKVFHGKKINFVSSKNTSFISIPLVSINNLKIDQNLIGTAFHTETDAFFSSLIYKKRLFLDKYLYNFLIEAFFFGKFFLLKDMIKRRFQNNKLKTIKRLTELKNNSLYLDGNKLQKSM